MEAYALQSFISVYLLFELALLVFSGYIFLQTSNDVMKNTERAGFKCFIVAFQIYTILTCVQTLQEYGIIDVSVGLYKGLCFALLLIVIVNAFCYYNVFIQHFDMGLNRSYKAVALGALPLLATIILLTVSLFNGIVFDVDKNISFVRGKWYYLIHIMVCIYFISIIRRSFLRARALGTARAKREVLGILGLTAFLILWVIIDDVLKGTTVIPVVIFAVLLYLFINSQKENIYTDALTGMNNRRKAENYLGEEVKNTSEKEPVYLFMGDINGFKEINDKYGHYEGDCALMIFSDAVKKSATAYNGFAARYGGDEFVWAWRPIKNGDVDPEMVMSDIRHRVEAECKAQNKKYIISLSIGHVLCTDPKISAIQYLREADRKMYADKQGYYRTKK
ncbi:MAG: GGDEF domain-containing protein [Clostridia bacterium]|nr:GGDEF domain-containing protein [Clostridia bacterium]